ncbi:GATA transcription factor [Forsythia ovata]|uniref:GATA transcription factor n=1 Tax=Forsythia ovata TaxID=205694 RepID=A0ABD1V0V6_9LAMI
MTKSSKGNCKKWIKMNSRTCVTRSKPSPIEKLTKDLYTIWHEQQLSCFSEFLEEDLLLESDKPIVSVEIGHGSVLIHHQFFAFIYPFIFFHSTFRGENQLEKL